MTSVEETLEWLVPAALEEDVGEGDWTTLWTVDADATGAAEIVAKKALVVAGTEAAVRVFRAVDPDLGCVVEAEDGSAVEAGERVMGVEGPVRSILTAERVALNFLGRLSGVATLTRRYVRAVEGTDARIVDTRKTTPGWRLLEKAAVRAGGGENHRMGLHDMVLVKDNHIAAGTARSAGTTRRVVGGIEAAVARVRAANERGLAVEVEVEDLEEVEAVLGLDVDRILLDNMDLHDLERAVFRVRSLPGTRPELEASGNVTLETVRRVAETGVDLISVGALTHSAPAVDLSLELLSRAR